MAFLPIDGGLPGTGVASQRPGDRRLLQENTSNRIQTAFTAPDVNGRLHSLSSAWRANDTGRKGHGWFYLDDYLRP
jgi:hypothetical protein